MIILGAHSQFPCLRQRCRFSFLSLCFQDNVAWQSIGTETASPWQVVPDDLY